MKRRKVVRLMVELDIAMDALYPWNQMLRQLYVGGFDFLYIEIGAEIN